MIWASADAVASNPRFGSLDGESIKIFTASSVGAGPVSTASLLMAALRSRVAGSNLLIQANQAKIRARLVI